LHVYNINTNEEHAKKPMSNNPRLADFVASLVDSVFHLHSEQLKYFGVRLEKIQITEQP